MPAMCYEDLSEWVLILGHPIGTLQNELGGYQKGYCVSQCWCAITSKQAVDRWIEGGVLGEISMSQ
jgi:hypothetical protein